MKYLGKTRALERLQKLKDEYAALIRAGYEHRAKDCRTCDTRGACCLDAHFVNVHITRLEAEAISRVISRLRNKDEVYARVEAAIDNYGLDRGGDSFERTYACPLFESGVGCLVHNEGKPLPCISHACYEKKEDLPPEILQSQREAVIESLNNAVYAGHVQWQPLPLAIRKIT